MRAIGIAVVVAMVGAVSLSACGGGGGSTPTSSAGAPRAGALPTKPVPPDSHSPPTAPGRAKTDYSDRRSEPSDHEHKDQRPAEAIPTNTTHGELEAPAEARPAHTSRPTPGEARSTHEAHPALERLVGASRSDGNVDASGPQGVEVTSDQAAEVLRQMKQEAREAATAPDRTEDPVERIIGELAAGANN